MLTKTEIVELFKRKLKRQIINIGLATGGYSSITYLITDIDGLNFYFKQGNVNYELQYELSQRLKELNVFVPEILAFDKTWMIEQGIVGQKLNIDDKSATIKSLKSLGEQLSIVHSFKTSNFGPLKNIRSGKYKNYFGYYENVIKIIPQKYHKMVLNYLNQNHLTCLNHGDVSPTHIYINSNGELISLIDWDDIVSAPSEFDLSELCLNLNNNYDYWNAFLNGYSKNIDISNLKIENLLIPELLQAYESYNWYLIEKKNDQILLQRIRESINLIESQLNNHD